jgi:hypothetical protein
MRNLISDVNGITQMRVFKKKGAEENIWTKEGQR